MLKVNEFEHGFPVLFSKQSNREYKINDVKDLFADDSKLLVNILQDHYTNQRQRLNYLKSYYDNQNWDIYHGSRRLNDNKADNRASHPFASYIADFHTSYSVGKPVSIRFQDDYEGKLIQYLNTIDKANETDTLNYSLFLDTSRYGRAYEQVYLGEDKKIHYTRLDPLTTFLIYDTSIEPQVLASVRYNIYDNFVTDDNFKITVEVYTDTWRYNYDQFDMSQNISNVKRSRNDMKKVPVVEYCSNEARTGDYEQVIPLIKLYDAAQSDTANYMQDFNDALLLLSGDLEASDLSPESLKSMIDANILALQSGKDVDGKQTSSDAKFLTKQMDSNSAESYKRRLAEDIHKFSKTPQYTDSDFANNVSGIAMQYKLLGTVEMAEIKRRTFAKGLHERYELVTNLMSKLSTLPQGWDIDKLNVSFTDNLPVDIDSSLTTFSSLGGKLSEETLLEKIVPSTIVDKPDQELERVKKQNKENIANQQALLASTAKPENKSESKTETDTENKNEK